MQSVYSNYVSSIKALSDETRLKIIDMLSCGSMCACDILELVNISQSTLSHHMKTLTDCGLVIGVKDGSWMRYSINKEEAGKLVSFITNIFTDKVDCICKNVDRKNKVNARR